MISSDEPQPGWTPPAQPAVRHAELALAGDADLIESVTRIDRAVKARRESDRTLINWWLYVLLVSWVTFGLYGVYLFFKRIARVDGFSRRKRAYYEALLEWTERQAATHEREDEVQHALGDLRSRISLAYRRDLRPIRAAVSFLLTIVTLGLYGLFVLYRLNRYWYDAQLLEQDVDDRLSQMWIALGILRYPVTYQVDQSKRRNYAVYLILSCVTVGIWGWWWDYKIHTDPDNLYGELHTVEDTVLQMVRAN